MLDDRKGGAGGAKRSGPVLALLCAAQFVVVLDVTIVAIALPEVRENLGFSATGLQWVVSAYTLVFGGFLLLAGRAADLYGRKKMFALGIALFSGASLACGLAPSPLWLVASRAAQGLGAAIVSPAALSLLTTTFPEGEGRRRAVGFWTAASAGGGALGWLLGGLLTEGLGWRWVFFVNVPVGAVCLALVPVLLAETRERHRRRPLDLPGAVTATAGLMLLVYGLTEAEEAGFSSPGTLAVLATSLALVGAFVFVEHRAVDPLVPLSVFRSRELVGSCLAAAGLNAATNAPLFLCILYLQGIVGLSPTAAGLAFVPFNLSVIAGSLAGSRLSGAIGSKNMMAVGLSSIALGTLLLVGISEGGGYLGYLLPGFALMGLGVGFSTVAATASGTSAVGDAKQGLVSGLLNTAMQVGTALGLAVLVPLAAARAAGGPEAALVEGYRLAFFGGAGLAVLVALVVFLLLRRNGVEKTLESTAS